MIERTLLTEQDQTNSKSKLVKLLHNQHPASHLHKSPANPGVIALPPLPIAVPSLRRLVNATLPEALYGALAQQHLQQVTTRGAGAGVKRGGGRGVAQGTQFRKDGGRFRGALECVEVGSVSVTLMHEWMNGLIDNLIS